MSTTIPQVAQAMQTVLTIQAGAAAKETKFVQRESKMTGAKFVQTLTFGWLANPQASLEELTQTAATLEVEISPQGLDYRFTKEAAHCLQQVLSAAVEQVLTADPVAIPLLQRFNGVYVHDSSTVTLPDMLAEEWAGCGGSTPGTAAALKLQVRLDLSTGALYGPLLQAGRAQDRATPLQSAPLPAGALRLADLGYFDLDVLAARSTEGSYWLTRWRAGTVLHDAATGERLDLVTFLRAQPADVTVVDHPVLLGAAHRLPGRLVAARVPPEVAEQRRRKLKAEARKKGQRVSPARLDLADWTIFLTNIPLLLASSSDVLVLARVRWQIELLFRLWKDHGRIDEWRSAKPWRILCEVYAKLLAMVVQHWLFLVSNWAYPDRSLRKAAQTVQKHALHLASVFACRDQLEAAIAVVQRCLSFGCRLNTRKGKPSTYQLLLATGGLP
jgi:hypothetical protein